MSTIKIVIWDNIGNTLLGMRPWAAWPGDIRTRLEAEDRAAQARIISLSELLAGYDLDLVWLYDPVASQRGFQHVFHEFGARLVPTSSPEVVAREVHEADFLVLHKETLAPEALAGADRLRLIQHLGLDHRGVPLDAAHRLGIPVAATPLINYSAVAEHVWAIILADLKRLADQRDAMASRAYLTAWGAYHPGVQIVSDLTLGLVGMGEIARPVARIARAFGMRTLYWDILRFRDVERSFGVEYVDWNGLFTKSDVISVHLALNEHTSDIIGAEEFSLMKPSALFVNTARGRLVDEVAMTNALADSRIRAVAIDAYAEEPLPGDSPLHEFHEAQPQRAVLTPHSAAQGPWTWVRDSQELWMNVRRSLDGEPLRHLVDQQLVPENGA